MAADLLPATHLSADCGRVLHQSKTEYTLLCKYYSFQKPDPTFATIFK